MKYFILLICLAFLFTSYGQTYGGTEGVKVPINTKGAGCVPPSTTTTLDINNVRCLVHTAGNLWQVPAQNRSIYEVPKNSGIMALFTSALWLGGTDANNQLKLAALRYRDGQDYWTGPLTNTSAQVDAETCSKYDKHFITKQDEVVNFVAWYQAGVQDEKDGTNLQSTLYPEYKIPDIIKDWPAHGSVSKGQDFYLAPYFDNNDDGIYNWEDGDYPWHDINKTKDCRTDRRVSLYGDLNYWWVMNDKGNIHTETGADPIGMEIRAQAFAFASNDEINNMTFYNYELINRGSLTLFNTYFGYFTDGALGGPFDDYVGCDVQRGLGYYYNGNNIDNDDSGFLGYGANPPAVGVDFFEGPYQDDDGIDNAYGIGEGEALNGIGYGDGIVDNERFGMRRFLYYSNTTNGADPSQTDPIGASDYYNYLQGLWKDGSPFYYGGSGHISHPDANPSVTCDFMFPGDTDPIGWGTGGFPQVPWTEESAGNVPNDRRFVQSAGPFVLKPGSVNNITVGVVYGRATTGGPFASVEILRRADDKAQALFENCFKLIEAPHAPDLTIQELDNELILFITNPNSSNNKNEEYIEFDPFIVADNPDADKNYRFQGYQIFQLVDNTVSASDLENPNKARLVAQCDIEDEISRIVNFEFDEQLQAAIPVEKVVGENKGIKHSFQVTEDLFAQGERRIVNFKRYYYMAIAYGHNNYKQYIPDSSGDLDGQKKPYLPSRKAALGEVKIVEAIPHNPITENGGTYTFLSYGDSPPITRLDGHGNGGRGVELSIETENEILKNGYSLTPTYKAGKGPIDILVVDPLNLAKGYFECKFHSYSDTLTNEATGAFWTMYRYDRFGGEIIDSVAAEQSIQIDNDQLIPKWGITVRIRNFEYVEVDSQNVPYKEDTYPISSGLSYADSSKMWLTFVSDLDGFNPLNWIRSGTYGKEDEVPDYSPNNLYSNPECYIDNFNDSLKIWSNVLEGGASLHALTGYECDFMPLAYFKSNPSYPNSPANPENGRNYAGFALSPSIDVVFTSDKSKWTRCPVIELGRDANLNLGGAVPGALRKSQSLNKNGMPDGTGTGMSWFPGYAIDVESGDRLYLAFGENSFLGLDNGSDLKWNPSARMIDGLGSPVLGGMHPIYVFSSNAKTLNGSSFNIDLGSYEESNNKLEELMHLVEETNGQAKRDYYSSLAWVIYPLATGSAPLLSSEARVKIRVNKEYKTFLATGENNGRPMYSWNMNDFGTDRSNEYALAEALRLINVVPNPYYAFSAYERSKLDNRVKITNLPQECTITIYSINGKLVRKFKKDSELTFTDWNLQNSSGIPVASGVYLIHVDVPGIGEKVLKLFAGMREADYYGY
jgi:hypothetical protein